MSEDRAKSPRPPLRAEDRRRLARDARRAVRLLAESLEEAGEDPSAATDAGRLLERVQAAVQPLTITGTAGIPSPAAFGQGGSVTLHPDSTTHSQTAGQPTMVEVPAPVVGVAASTLPTLTASAAGFVTRTSNAEGGTPESVEVTPEDVPYLLAEMADTLQDLLRQGGRLSHRDVLQWALFAMAYLSLLIQVLDR